MPSAAAVECHALLLLLGLAANGVACGPEVPARVPGAPDTVIVDSAPAKAPAKKQPVADDGAFRAAWIQQTPPFNEAVAIAQQCPGLPYGIRVEVRPIAPQCPIKDELVSKEQLAHA